MLPHGPGALVRRERRRDECECVR